MRLVGAQQATCRADKQKARPSPFRCSQGSSSKSGSRRLTRSKVKEIRSIDFLVPEQENRISNAPLVGPVSRWTIADKLGLPQLNEGVQYQHVLAEEDRIVEAQNESDEEKNALVDTFSYLLRSTDDEAGTASSVEL